MLCIRCYTSDIAVLDMFTVILANTFDFFQDHDPTRWSCFCQWDIAIFFHSVIITLFSYFTMLNFIHDRHEDWGKYLSKYGMSTEPFWVKFIAKLNQGYRFFGPLGMCAYDSVQMWYTKQFWYLLRCPSDDHHRVTHTVAIVHTCSQPTILSN